MALYKVVIIDDEHLAINVLTHYLERFPNFEVVKTFTNPEEAFIFLKNTNVDLVFTDIAMPKISGTELVKLLKNNTAFVMATSYTEYAIESFELNVIDYLLKPIPFERFAKTIERFENNTANNSEVKTTQKSFFIKDGDEFIKVQLSDIDYIEGMKDYIKIVCGKNYYTTLKTLKSVENSLADYGFIRVHKSFIVPLSKITQYNGRLVFIGQHTIPVGNSYRNTLKQYFIDRKL